MSHSQAALQQPERVGDHPRVQHVLDGDRGLERGARVLRRPFIRSREILSPIQRRRCSPAEYRPLRDDHNNRFRISLRRFQETPDNFWFVTVQPRDRSLSITVRGLPDRFKILRSAHRRGSLSLQPLQADRRNPELDGRRDLRCAMNDAKGCRECLEDRRHWRT